MGPVQIIIYCCTFVVWIVAVNGSGCQHQCNCGFKWTGDDTDEGEKTLRHEVMGGLIGAFAPLFLAGLCYVIYKKLCKPPGPAPTGKGPTTHWGREGSWAGGKISPRGTTPISLYGETEDGFPSFPSGNSGVSDSGLTSRYTNIHKNHPKNELNQWFKNVSNMKY